MKVLDIISLGAGVQSSTMAFMAAHGEITPMPDCAIFADTGAEPAGVYKWLDWLETQLPFKVIRVSAGNIKDDLLSEGRAATAPFFTFPRGMLWRQCTSEYKIQPIRKYLRSLKQPIRLWMGISIDESSRMKPSQVKYITNYHPLIENNMSRQDCLDWMKNKNYPTPPKSACTFCPYHSNEMWRDMKLNDPESFADAIIFDNGIRKRGGKGEWYLHRSLKPLSEIDFRTAEDAGQLSMFDNECEGMCGL